MFCPPNSKGMNSSSSIFFLLLLLLFLQFLSISSQTQQLPNTTITYENFYFNGSKSNDSDLFAFLGDSKYAQGALQLTPDSQNYPETYLTNKSGRVVFRQRFKLWDQVVNATVVASFNTTFDVNIYRVNGSASVGEGLAFGIFPDLAAPPPNSYGGYLGLTNSTTDGDPTNQFVAIELDTSKQWYDPNDNHIGLDINSVRSNVSASPTNSSGGNMVFSPNDPKGVVYTIWVDYNGPKRKIEVYMALALGGQTKPVKPVFDHELDLSKNLNKYSYFGFSGSTGTSYELNCIKRWVMTVDILPEKPGPDVKGWLLKAGLPIVLILVIAGVLVLVLYIRERRQKIRCDSRLQMKLMSLPGMPKEYEFKDLKSATNNFDERNRLGQGGYGSVYRGKLHVEGEETEVAVKKFNREDSNQSDFLSELTIINRLRHRNLVPLLGWSYKNSELHLVYAYMPNGSLDKYLFNPNARVLTWSQRFNAVAGVASGLHYLHNEYNQKVVHRDLKASNIMLDAEFNACLGDFGLARTIDNEKTSFTEQGRGMPGTAGYIAPECLHTLKATIESDVYGFGAVILEIVCGRRPVGSGLPNGLLEWVWDLYREERILEAVDPRLEKDFVAEEAERLLMLGLACSHPMAAERPKTKDVVQIINKLVALPVVPRIKPAFVWPGNSVTLNMVNISTSNYQNADTSTTSNSTESFNGTTGYNARAR